MKFANNRTIAIASGKGGVGKTIITANLALSLAQRYESKASVVAVDLDLGCGNLNSCLGVRSPNGTIDGFLSNKVQNLQQLLTPTHQANLQMICSSYNGSPSSRLDKERKKGLLTQLSGLGSQFTLIDLGAGTSDDVVDIFLGASEKIVVVTPESLSLHNAFVFLKTAILRFLWNELESEDFLGPVKSKLEKMISGQEELDVGILIDRLKLWDRYAAYVLAGLIDDLKIKFIINMYRGGAEKAHLTKFHDLLFRYLRIRNNLSYLGFVHFDHGVPSSVKAIKPFLLTYPRNRAAQDIVQVAENLAEERQLYSAPSLRFPKRSWWPPTLWKR
ncbi:MAG: P-loop NTPase [Acidobacteriota bacterium]